MEEAISEKVQTSDELFSPQKKPGQGHWCWSFPGHDWPWPVFLAELTQVCEAPAGGTSWPMWFKRSLVAASDQNFQPQVLVTRPQNSASCVSEMLLYPLETKWAMYQ